MLDHYIPLFHIIGERVFPKDLQKKPCSQF